MHLSASITLQAPTTYCTTFAKSRANNKPRARTSILASMDASMPLLKQRIQQLKASERQNEWRGYGRWRESKDSTGSPFAGYSEWRSNDAEEEQRMMDSLRLRLSKPAVAPGEDLGAEKDHFDRSSSLDKWHNSCWQQFKDSSAFGNSEDAPEADESS